MQTVYSPRLPNVDTTVELSDQPFDTESLCDSEDAELVPIQSGEDWVAHEDWVATTICPDRPLRLANCSGSPRYSLRITPVSQCCSGSGRILFLRGQRLSHCVRNCAFVASQE